MNPSKYTKKVLIATPSYDGNLNCFYVNSLINTIRLGQSYNIEFQFLFIAYDSLLERARNTIFKRAIDTLELWDSILFIDADMEWDPAWAVKLALAEEDVIGGSAPKKNDQVEKYVTSITDFSIHSNGYIKADALGFGFVKMSMQAILALWDSSPVYENEASTCRRVCHVDIEDGQLIGEDTVVYRKLKKLGYDIWLDPSMTCNHMGIKKYQGDFAEFLVREGYLRAGV